jgi:hypothetical protein
MRTRPTVSKCAADAAFWAEQQKVAITGWLREDLIEGLHHEEHFASIKHRPDHQPLRRMRLKEEFLAVGGGGFKMANRAILPPTSMATFGLEPASFQEIWWDLMANPQAENKGQCPASQVKRRPSATGLLLRTHSDGPVSQTCLLRLLRRELAKR